MAGLGSLGKAVFSSWLGCEMPLPWFGLGPVPGPTIHVPWGLGQAPSLWASVSLRELSSVAFTVHSRES